MRRIALFLLATTTFIVAEERPDLPLVDISDQKDRHTIIAAGT